MIGDALRTDIEAYAARRHQNPVFSMAERGTLTSEMMRRYIGCVHYMIRRTPVHLTRARERALELGDARLAAHFEQKLEEERGHDAWSAQDLASLAQMTSAPVEGDVPAAAMALGAYVEERIEEDPVLHLAYMAFAEYLTVILAPEWLGLLETRCGIPRTSVTVIDNHLELDRAHAEEAFCLADDLVGDPRKLGRMREALAGAIRFYDACCQEAVAAVDADEAGGRRVPAA